MHHKSGPASAPLGSGPLIGILRNESEDIVLAWVSEINRVPFSKVSEVTSPVSVRSERFRNYFGSLIEYAADPSSLKARESLRSALRSEHLRTLDLSRVVMNQHALRKVLYDIIESKMPSESRDVAKEQACSIVDLGVLETSALMGEYAQLQSVLNNCMSSTLGVRSELDHAFAKFCRNAMDYFDADFVSVFRLQEDANDMICLVCAAKGVVLSRGTMISLNRFTMAAEAIDQRTTKTCVSNHWSPMQRKKILGNLSFEHCLAVPLIHDDEVEGLLFIGDSTGPNPFTPDEVSLAEEIGADVMKVLNNVDMFERLSIMSRAQRALIETAANLQQEIESSEVFRIIGDKMSELIPCNELAFYVFDWSRNICNPAYATGPYASEIMEDRNFPVDVGYIGHVSRTKKAEIVLDTEDDPRGEQIPGTPVMHCRMLVIPILGRKDVLGVIELTKYPPDTFSKEDLEVATLFANHAAVAMENAQLLKEVSRTRDQMELYMDLMTHDIANYTTPMIAYIDSIGSRKDLDPQVISAVMNISSQMDNIMQMVDMVRTMHKVRHNGSVRLTPFLLEDTIHRAIDKTKRKVQNKSLEIEVRMSGEPVRVMADELLEGLFENLFVTAAKSTRQDPVMLQVHAEPRREGRNEMWWVKISQPGRSIPDNLKREVLRMTKAAKSELSGGFGMGLATSRAIAERYVGSMWITDMVPGNPSNGCVFNISLPRAP
ncbi:MAG: GAF domain-containing sensor histidine kinase [Candidatus Thermoplasmatota archaeon]|nr:GAF domain-containing sensor histidine kinase [Candidatus Thermoplasmatota archaeon]